MVKNKAYLNLITTAILLAFSIATAKAQIAVTKVELNPDTLLVGDVAECKVTLYNPDFNSVKVLSVKLDPSYGLSVEPKFISVGQIPKQSYYNLVFYITAERSGLHTVEMKVDTNNGSITQMINVIVEDKLPRVVINSPIRLNEVNEINLEISSPIKIEKVVVEPMFEAEQKCLFFDTVDFTAKAKIKFYGKIQNYKFKISFYNGQNLHTLIQEVKPIFIESKGLFANISLDSNVYLYDVIPIKVTLSNLREDDIYEITAIVNSSNGIVFGNIKIPKLDSMQDKTSIVYYSPNKSGLDEIKIKITYKDEIGNVYYLEEKKKVEVLNETTVAITNLDVNTKNGVTISGDVSNNGRSEISNVYAIVSLESVSKDYFIGSIDPSDFQSFSISLNGNGSKALVKVLWTNKVGKNFEVVKEVKVKRVILKEERPPLWIVAIVVLIVVSFVAISIYNYRKK